jgi:hypothetical protein
MEVSGQLHTPNLKIKYIHCKLNTQLTLTYDMLVSIKKRFLAQNSITDLPQTRLQILKSCGPNLVAQRLFVQWVNSSPEYPTWVF